MMESGLYWIYAFNIVVNSTLSFFTSLLLIEGCIALFRVAHPRVKVVCRVLPFIKICLDLCLYHISKWALIHGVNPTLAEKGTRQLALLLNPFTGIQFRMKDGKTFSIADVIALSIDPIWHNGGTGGFRSYLGFNPKTQKGVVVLSNSTADWPDEFGSVILDPNYQRPIVDRTLANDPAYLNKFVGCFGIVFPDDLSNQQLQISVFGKLLASALSGGEVGMLYPESHGVFGVKGFPDGIVYFSFDDSGNISNVEARLISNGTILWKAIPAQVQ